MKDIVISVRRQRREMKFIAFCFVCAVAINAYSIITYETSWVELFSQIGWTTIITGSLYVITIAVRVILRILKGLFVRR